jgi:hypothetical protein
MTLRKPFLSLRAKRSNLKPMPVHRELLIVFNGGPRLGGSFSKVNEVFIPYRSKMPAAFYYAKAQAFALLN